jgi:carboxypeptidase family protein/Big-like domain-containing protein
MKRVCLATATLAITTLMACSGKSVDNPTAPSPSLPATPGPAVSALVITNQAVSDNTMQMIATARFADATTRDVTTSSTWVSSNTSVATISSSGMLTIVSSGDVDVRADYQGAAASLHLVLNRPPDPRTHFALSGTAREVSPGTQVLGNVRIAITEGPDAGTTVTSDPSGQFRFASVSATRVSLEATRDGFQLWRMTNLMIAADTRIDVVMFPTPPTNDNGVTATGRCKDSTWTWSTSVLNACSDHGGLAYGVCPGPMCGAPLKPRS